MKESQFNGHTSFENDITDDFELMGDMPREAPAIIERRRQRNNEISKKLGAYLLKGYCMLSDACADCDCILLRTPDRQLLCVGCAEVDVANAKEIKETTNTEDKKDEQQLRAAENKKKRSKKQRKKRNSSSNESENISNEQVNYSTQLESKLKWAVDELAKSHNPNRINAMCTVIIQLTESIKALKEYESATA